MTSNDNLEELLRQMYAQEKEDIDTSEIIDEEWRKFEAKHFDPKSHGDSVQGTRSHKRPIPVMLKIAASIIVVLALSGITYAAIVIAEKTKAKTEKIATTVEAGNSENVAVADTSISVSHPSTLSPKTFENVPLKDIAQELADAYHLTVEVKNSEAAALRLYYPWNPQMPIQQVMDELNRFEKVHLTIANNQIVIE